MAKVQYPVYSNTGMSSSTFFLPIDTSAFEKADFILRVKNDSGLTTADLELSKMAYEYYDENSFGESTESGDGPTHTISSGGSAGVFALGMTDDIGAMLLPKLEITATSVDIEVHVIGIV